MVKEMITYSYQQNMFSWTRFNKTKIGNKNGKTEFLIGYKLQLSLSLCLIWRGKTSVKIQQRTQFHVFSSVVSVFFCCLACTLVARVLVMAWIKTSIGIRKEQSKSINQFERRKKEKSTCQCSYLYFFYEILADWSLKPYLHVVFVYSVLETPLKMGLTVCGTQT